MNYEEELKAYNDWQFKISAYEMALHIIDIDKMTVAPPGGSFYRDERTAFLSGELYTLKTDPAIIEILRDLSINDKADELTARKAKLYYEDIMKQVCVSKEDYVAYARLTTRAYDIWLEAKRKSDYRIFEPCLKELIEAVKKMIAARKKDETTYDQLLGDYEPGMNTAKYDEFFGAIKERLVPLIARVKAAKPIDDGFIHQYYDPVKQKEYVGETLLPYLCFEPSWGYQNETEHPFTGFICENDCRTTTKYLPDNAISAIFSTIHEVGHATYEHQCSPECDGNILSEGISSGMHESQSRLLENYIGRTEAFWKANYPALQEKFPDQLKAVSLAAFVSAVNAAKCDLIRTEADELTYPMHIIIRYEIEKGMFNGTLTTENLNTTWNDLYEKYLGIKVPSDREGILQDVHWSMGNFGYFPTYALGSAYAAQIVNTMRKDIDVDDLLARGEFARVREWLKEHVHCYGFRYDPPETIIKATGHPFDVNEYIDYLENKYTKLYKLNEE